MLIKNEAEHLDVTLPQWAKFIDYWVIGVDDQNTDNSAEIITKHLGHIPGEIVIVEFDGMGPTWTQLVNVGLEKYPEATHGIIADADFLPMQDSLDKRQLDVRCSKHLFTIWTQDLQNERRMDWIYRNIPGARVERRVHQSVKVPPIPGQEVFQTMIDLKIQEHQGGYQDRTPGKMLRYIEWLEKDLVDYPNDPRTLYYLGYSHFDIFLNRRQIATQEDWDHLAESVRYYDWRIQYEGNEEEKWFSILKLGEIYERFYRDWDKAKSYYERCAEQDPERADSFFYLGQYYRLRNRPLEALPYLEVAASLPIPSRALFHWHFLYYCLSKLEYARAVHLIENPSLEVLKKSAGFLAQADCSKGDAEEIHEYAKLSKHVSDLLAPKEISRQPYEIARGIAKFIRKYSERVLRPTCSEELFEDLNSFENDLIKLSSKGADLSCEEYTAVISDFIEFYDENEGEIREALVKHPKKLKMLRKLVDYAKEDCQ